MVDCLKKIIRAWPQNWLAEALVLFSMIIKYYASRLRFRHRSPGTQKLQFEKHWLKIHAGIEHPITCTKTYTLLMMGWIQGWFSVGENTHSHFFNLSYQVYSRLNCQAPLTKGKQDLISRFILQQLCGSSLGFLDPPD